MKPNSTPTLQRAARIRAQARMAGRSSCATPATRRAFSLVELIVVIVIIATVAAIAVPRYGSALAHYRVDAAAGRLAADLEAARTLARASSMRHSVEFDLAGNTYRIFDGDSFGTATSVETVALTGEPYRASILDADFNLTKIAGFDGYGDPVSGGWVVVRSGDTYKTITVDADSGTVTISSHLLFAGSAFDTGP